MTVRTLSQASVRSRADNPAPVGRPSAKVAVVEVLGPVGVAGGRWRGSSMPIQPSLVFSA